MTIVNSALNDDQDDVEEKRLMYVFVIYVTWDSNLMTFDQGNAYSIEKYQKSIRKFEEKVTTLRGINSITETVV